MLLKTLKIRKSCEDDIKPIALNMRAEDRKEIWDSNYHLPETALEKGLRANGKAWTVLVDNIPVAMMGVTRPTLLSDKGAPWLLSTDELVLNITARLFIKVSKSMVECMKQGFSVLENHVSVENKVSLAWLKKLGFLFGEESKSPTGVMFKKFYMETTNV